MEICNETESETSRQASKSSGAASTMLNCWRNVRGLSKNVRTFTEMVRIVEVGPRDGLQNIKNIIPTETKIDLINKLSESGLRSIEVTSFVSAKWVPQMADSKEVYEGVTKNPNVEYSVLVPNLKGLKKAAELCVYEVELFIGATETFNQKNLNSSIESSLCNLKEMREYCKEKNIRTRAAVSCVLGCPYEGEVKPKVVAKVVEALFDMGCYEIALGDTIGVGTPLKIATLLNELKSVTGGDVWRFAVHCHDTYGQALANIYESLNQGIRVFDSSIAGLGGCPYAPGATGNVSTEDLVYLIHGQGMKTGIDLEQLIRIGDFITRCIPGQSNNSKVGKAFLAREMQCAS